MFRRVFCYSAHHLKYSYFLDIFLRCTLHLPQSCCLKTRLHFQPVSSFSAALIPTPCANGFLEIFVSQIGRWSFIVLTTFIVFFPLQKAWCVEMSNFLYWIVVAYISCLSRVFFISYNFSGFSEAVWVAYISEALNVTKTSGFSLLIFID